MAGSCVRRAFVGRGLVAVCGFVIGAAGGIGSAQAGGEKCAAAARAAATTANPASPDGLEVHEWGTFTSFSRPDGSLLTFNSTIGDDLPNFVWSRPRQGGEPNAARDPFWSGKIVMASLQRMETPVLYFYTDKPVKVSVEVGFPQGLVTEFYPPLSAMEPAWKDGFEKLPHASIVRWDNLSVQPVTSDSQLAAIPQVEGKTHYIHARDVDSALVSREHDGKQHAERMIFYRGVGDFRPEIRLAALGEDRFVLSNGIGGEQGATPRLARGKVPAAFLIENRGGKVRFSRGGELTVGATQELRLPAEASAIDTLSRAVEDELVRAGLYEREAAAMVNTWRELWFHEEGTRVLYLMPRELVDSVLPLAIAPTPNKIERVFVGRLEIITPEAQRQAERMLAGPSGEQQLSEKQKEAFWKDAGRMFGRFTRAAIDSTGRSTADAEAKAGYEVLGRR